MKIPYPILGIALLLSLPAACSKKPNSTAEQHDHNSAHQTKEAGGSWTKPAKKFAVDENLRVRMNKVLETMHSLEAKPAQQKNFADAGKKITETVKDIFANCVLAPDADAAIHPILGELLKGAELFKTGRAEEGHALIHNALLRYEDFFSHPGWQH
jgi:hypothetical protein